MILASHTISTTSSAMPVTISSKPPSRSQGRGQGGENQSAAKIPASQSAAMGSAVRYHGFGFPAANGVVTSSGFIVLYVLQLLFQFSLASQAQRVTRSRKMRSSQQ